MDRELTIYRGLLRPQAIRLQCQATGRFDAVRQAGQVLVEIGAVEPPYVEAMLERERQISTYVGEGFALPHGTDASRVWIRCPALAYLRFPHGVDWEGEQVFVCLALAIPGDEHLGLLSRLAQILMDPAKATRLRTATSVEEVFDLLSIGEEP
ncbi:MAG TPA: PTS sugar transporter subunit IIA [Thermoflexus sp.]|nr:PTS sugar transporter subunit IIA [Thermoflexus sp.]